MTSEQKEREAIAAWKQAAKLSEGSPAYYVPMQHFINKAIARYVDEMRKGKACISSP